MSTWVDHGDGLFSLRGIGVVFQIEGGEWVARLLGQPGMRPPFATADEARRAIICGNDPRIPVPDRSHWEIPRPRRKVRA